VPANTTIQYPGIDNETQYTEKLLVGYRYYDALNLNPLFKFGFGLSYTSFEYSNLKISGHDYDVFITVNVNNVGMRDGGEVVQLYLNFPSNAGEPPKILKGF